MSYCLQLLDPLVCGSELEIIQNVGGEEHPPQVIITVTQCKQSQVTSQLLLLEEHL